MEALTFNMLVFGGEVFGRLFGLGEVMGMSNEESRGRVFLAVGQSDAKVQCGSSFGEFQ